MVPFLIAGHIYCDDEPFIYQEGWTALHFASQDGQVQVAEILIKNGAKVDAKGKVSITKSIWAARRSVQLRVRCVRQSSLAMLYLIWSGHLQGTSIG